MRPKEIHLPDGGGRRRKVRKLVALLIALAALAASAIISIYWLNRRPHTGRRRPEVTASLVEVTPVRSAAFKVRVSAMGTVVAAREVVLASRVGGEIVGLSPELVPGGRFKAGQVIASIDPEDYKLAIVECQADITKRTAELAQKRHELAQRRMDVIRAESELKLEMGRQEVARQEYELLGEALRDEDREFVLRQPQLAAAKANREAAAAAKESAEAACEAAASTKEIAEVSLKKAKLDLDRTAVRAPFNAVVTAKSVELGTQGSPGTGLATLVSTDEYWVEVSVPVDELKWITLPGDSGGKGSPVRIRHEAAWGTERSRTGYVRRLAAELEPQGRMARLIVGVEDPICLKPENAGQPAMILGAYVRAVIEGADLKDAISVPRSALRDGNRVWVMGPDDSLDIREVAIVWRGRQTVCIGSGLRDGDRLIVSDLAAPVQGMPLRVLGDGRQGDHTEGADTALTGQQNVK